MPLVPTAPCPCGRPLPYARCCGRWHAGPEALQAPTAEDLMRSRYSAFVGGLLVYLTETWHPSKRPVAIEPMPEGLRWLGLDVRRHVQQDADHATVEFVARSKLGGKAERLHETSRFVREGGRWFYMDGDIDTGSPKVRTSLPVFEGGNGVVASVDPLSDKAMREASSDDAHPAPPGCAQPFE